MTDLKGQWQGWRTHFERQARRPLPPRPFGDEGLSPAKVEALGIILAQFQLGETGEGRIAKEIDQSHWSVIDDDYRQALKLFVREEGRHARILKGLVQGLDGTLLRRQWSTDAFTRLRRLLGPKHKLLVLLAAEIVGMTFYGAVARKLPDGSYRQALAAIAADEVAHRAFHSTLFRALCKTRRQQVAFAALWWPLIGGAASALWIDQRLQLTTLGVSGAHLFADAYESASWVDAVVRRRRPHPGSPSDHEDVLAGGALSGVQPKNPSTIDSGRHAFELPIDVEFHKRHGIEVKAVGNRL
jgi:hypothetical protein